MNCSRSPMTAMKHAKESAIKWVEQRSPRGRFHLFRRHISEALGAPREAGIAGGGHPFDVELARLPPGATNFPFHAHAAQWEEFITQLFNWATDDPAGGTVERGKPRKQLISLDTSKHSQSESEQQKSVWLENIRRAMKR